MYFNESNNTNIDRELKKEKAKAPKEKKKFYFTRDMLLMCFYALLLITGIVMIISFLR